MSDNELQIVDEIYATAIEPERFDELVKIWDEKLSSSEAGEFQNYPGTLTGLQSHLQRADAILSLVADNPSMLPGQLFQILNNEPRPTLVLDETGNLFAQNDGAETQFQLLVGQNISELVSDPAQIESLKKIAARRVYELSPPDERLPELLRVWIKDYSEQIIFSTSAWVTAAGKKLVLLRSSDFIWPLGLSPALSNAFDLTGAETDVIKLVVEGASLSEVADIRDSSIATVRTQIRSIYAKTGTKNQSELLRMALGLVTLSLPNQKRDLEPLDKAASAANQAWPLTEHMRLFRLKDGRILEYADCGPADGLPCLYFHNDFLGNVWPRPAADALAQKNLRLIIPSRPYYGQSSPYPKGVINYEQIAEDWLALLDHLHIPRVLHVSYTTGGMTSLAMALRDKDRCAGFVSIAPAFAVTSAEEEKQMPIFYRFMNGITYRHPSALEAFMKLGTSYLRRIGSDRFLTRIFRDVPADAAVLKDASNMQTMVRGLEFCTTHKYLGAFNDYKHILPNSNEVLRNLPIQIFVIVGDADENSRMQRTNRLIESGVKIQKTVATAGGTLLHFTHPALIAETIEKAWLSAPD